ARQRVLADIARGGLQLVLVAPERLAVSAFREALQRCQVSLIAVDEAHCISEWGHDFRPHYRRIGLVRDWVDAPVMALTATATPRVREDITTSLDLRRPERVVGSFDRPNLSWHVVQAEDHTAKVRRIRHLVRTRHGPAIIYAPTRRTADALRRSLAGLGIPAAAYHAGMAAEVRSRVQGQFMDGHIRVVVATSAFGMGVDKADVRTVIHYQLPGTIESYYQEAGRGGRDGAPADCVALHGRRDAVLLRSFVDRSRPGRRVLESVHRTLTREVGAGERKRVPVSTLLSVTLRGRSPVTDEDTLRAAILSLARSGAIRIYGDVAPEGTLAPNEGFSTLDLGVRRGAPNLDPALRLRRAALEGLAAVQAYAGRGGCRRSRLLAYFGETGAKRCGACDVCLNADAEYSRQKKA
ncbi:MAG: RecQ family ATP-dependent DNA helicase, partial [Longimicrobiales bacterium]